MHSSVPRGGGLMKAQRENRCSVVWLLFMLCTSLPFFPEEKQQDTLWPLSFNLRRCFVLYYFPLPLSFLFHIGFSIRCFFPLQKPSLPLHFGSFEHSKYSWPHNSYGFLSGSHSPLSHDCNGAPGNYLNDRGFTQLSTDWECSPSIVESKGNKMAACWQRGSF